MNRCLASASVCLALACGGASSPELFDDAGADAAAEAAPPGPVSIDLTTCPALTPCGGDVTGTWKLEAGCADDPLATAKGACPTLVVTSEVATAQGSVTFASGIVTRDYESHYAMDITVPSECLANATCAQLETSFRAYIPNTSCTATATAGCRCTGSLDATGSQGSTYTTMNDEIVTGGGDHYAYCVSGSTMQYRHVSGPTPEIGSYTLSK